MRRVWWRARRHFNQAVAAIIPERCPVCSAPVAGGGLGQPVSLCSQCFSQLHLVHAPICRVCGWPQPDPKQLCPHCPESRAITRKRFAMTYGEAATALILRLKHGDKPELARRLALWMAQAGEDSLADADLLVPVPVHWSRLLKRQYNQSSEIARALAKLSHLRVDHQCLVRKRATPPQGHKSARDRHKNVKNAFALQKSRDVVGLNIVLIDDVVTTGATLEECAQILLDAGAKQVDALTAAAVDNT